MDRMRSLNLEEESAMQASRQCTACIVQACIMQKISLLGTQSDNRQSHRFHQAVNSEAKMDGYEIVRMTPEHLPGAILVLREAFFTSENVCKAIHILEDSEEIPNDSGYKLTVAAKELEDLALDTAKDGISFAAVEKGSNRVLGVAFNKIQVKPQPGQLSYFEQFAKDHIKDSAAVELVDFMVKVDSRFDLFGNYDTNCLFEIMFLAVMTHSKGRGIGSGLVRCSVNLAQTMKTQNEMKTDVIDFKSDAGKFRNSSALKSIPKCVTAIFTSKFSQECGRRNGFTQVLVAPYTEFVYKGRVYADTLGPDHPFCALCVKTLQ